jgi:hypothetical protein
MRAILPAIGFLAIERRHVGLEVAAGLKDTAFRQVSVTGEDGVLDNPFEESSCGQSSGLCKLPLMPGLHLGECVLASRLRGSCSKSAWATK